MNRNDLLKYNRVFTFGCSFTRYLWPTWATILEYDLEGKIEFYNYGASGSSNEGIARRILEANLVHNFTENDAIFILWTSWSRLEKYLDGGWYRVGNLARMKDYVKLYWSDGHEIISNSNAIISTNNFLKNKIKFQGHVLDIEWNNYKKNNPKIVDFYKKHIPGENYFYYNDPKTLITYTRVNVDNHPTIDAHLYYLENYINYQVTNKTKLYCDYNHQKVKEIFNRTMTKNGTARKAHTELQNIYNLDHPLEFY